MALSEAYATFGRYYEVLLKARVSPHPNDFSLFYNEATKWPQQVHY
jgi:hypothetical protein